MKDDEKSKKSEEINSKVNIDNRPNMLDEFEKSLIMPQLNPPFIGDDLNNFRPESSLIEENKCTQFPDFYKDSLNLIRSSDYIRDDLDSPVMPIRSPIEGYEIFPSGDPFNLGFRGNEEQDWNKEFGL